jgi:hypothetical protein
VDNIIIEPKNQAEALERIKTLPWAFSTREDGDEMIRQWMAGDREHVLNVLNAEIDCHKGAGNEAKATYIQNVERVLHRVHRVVK